MSLPNNSKSGLTQVDFVLNPFIHFEIQGRLGNQLFGLSDAFRLAHFFNRKAILDIWSVSQEYGDPEWLQYAQEWKWAEISTSPVEHLEAEAVTKVNVGLTDPKKSSPNSHFHGFNPKIRDIEESGLFQRGRFPFSDGEPALERDNQLALCIRRGDYHQNPHLGILSANYYRKALDEIPEKNSNYEIVVFCDSKEETELFLKSNDIPYSRFDEQLNALEALRNLSRSSVIVMANSTFSFWGSFFSSGRTFFPDPFYISEPEWGAELSEGSIVIKHMRLPRLRYFLSLIHQKCFRSFQEK